MKHGLKRFTRCVLVAALSVSLAVPTMAATKAEVQSQIENLKNQQSELESQLASLKKNKSDTESYISELDSKIKTYLAQLEEVSAQLEQTESEISITQDNLAQAKEDEKTQYTALKARIKAMYESGDDDYLQMLLGSGDLKTMLNNQEYISKINEYDHNLLVSLQNIRDQIAAYEAQLEEQKELQEAQKEQYEVEKESLEKIVAQKEEELVAISTVCFVDLEDLVGSGIYGNMEIVGIPLLVVAIELSQDQTVPGTEGGVGFGAVEAFVFHRYRQRGNVDGFWNGDGTLDHQLVLVFVGDHCQISLPLHIGDGNFQIIAVGEPLDDAAHVGKHQTVVSNGSGDLIEGLGGENETVVSIVPADGIGAFFQRKAEITVADGVQEGQGAGKLDGIHQFAGGKVDGIQLFVSAQESSGVPEQHMGA